MTTTGESCTCPFCSPRTLCLTPSMSSVPWKVCCIILLLLLGGCEASRLRGIRSAGEMVSQPDSAVDNVRYVEGSINVPDCTATTSCACTPVGKCRPCSRLDISQKLPECLFSGYKQRSLCTDTQLEKYISCHYVVNPVETQRFWLFEGSVFSVGMLAYAVVVFRIRKMDRQTARRIQQQINA